MEEKGACVLEFHYGFPANRTRSQKILLCIIGFFGGVSLFFFVLIVHCYKHVPSLTLVRIKYIIIIEPSVLARLLSAIHDPMCIPTDPQAFLFVIHVIFHILMEKLYCYYVCETVFGYTRLRSQPRKFVTQVGQVIVIGLDVTCKGISTSICPIQ